MSSINGMAQQRLDEIQLRLVGADHRPWAMSPHLGLDDEGRRFVGKGNRKTVKKAVQHAYDAAESKAPTTEPDESGVYVDKITLVRELALFHRTNLATDDMLDFIAHAPEDIEALLNEVFCLREMVKKLQGTKSDAVKELLGKRVEATRAEEKIVDMRRAWRLLCKEMGTKP